jgi:hypothetical protein
MSRRPGRPPLDRDDPSVQMSLRLPARQYEALCRAATVYRTTVPDLVRLALVREIQKPKIGRSPTGR